MGDQVVMAADIGLRDWFAGQAVAGYLAAHADQNVSMPKSADVAAYAYRVADAMLAARAKPPLKLAEVTKAEAESAGRA